MNFLNFTFFGYLVYSQIWLNLLVDDHKSGYITKSKKKKDLALVPRILCFPFIS